MMATMLSRWIVIRLSAILMCIAMTKLALGEQSSCMQSLLLERQRISPEAFTATSEQVDPTGRRRYAAESVRTESTDYAWCPAGRIGTELNEFVQIDMGELNAITKLVISGLLAESGGYRSSPYFYVRYKREWNEPEWRTYRQFSPIQTSQLVGSTEPLVPKFIPLNPPLVARWIQIYPYRDSPGFVCVRLEAYGCRFAANLIEYQIPEGSVFTPPYHAPPPPSTLLHSNTPLKRPHPNQTHHYQAGGGPAFSDVCYDGYRVEPGSLLDGGLGCLTDFAIASQTATPSPDSDPRLFVGWHRNRWLGQRSVDEKNVVDMRFRFASVRRFELLTLFVSNNFLEKIRLPRRIEVRFSVGGVQFSGQPMIAQNFHMDNRTSGVMRVEVPLDNRVGQFVQLKVFFADDWLLISEISFSSHLSTDPVLPEDTHTARDTTSHSPMKTVLSTSSGTTPSHLSAELLEFSGHFWPTVIVLVVLIVIFLGIIVFTCARLCWKRKYWHMAKPQNSRQHHQQVTDGLLSASNQNQLALNVDGTILKRPHFDDSENHNPSHEHFLPIRSSSNQFIDPASSVKQNGSIYPQRSRSRRVPAHIWSALLCLGRKSRQLQSQNSQLTSRSATDSMSAAQPYSTVVDASNGVANNLPQLTPGDALKFEQLTQRLPTLQPNGKLMVPDEWILCSSASNSTAASLCPPAAAQNTEVNLYTSVGGESDADSSMSPEYASTTHGWSHTVMQQPQHPALSRNSYLAVNPAASSPRQMTNSLTLNGLNTPGTFAQPYVYFNPGLLPNDSDGIPFYTPSSAGTVYVPVAFGTSVPSSQTIRLGNPSMTNWGTQQFMMNSPRNDNRAAHNHHHAMPEAHGPWVKINRFDAPQNDNSHPPMPPSSPPPPPPAMLARLSAAQNVR